MELLSLFGFIVVVAIGVIGYNFYKRPDWVKRKIANLTKRNP